MSQQINLFDPRFRKRLEHFSALTMVLALGAVLVLSLVIRELYAYQNRSLQASLAQTDQRAAELRDQTVRFAKEFGEQGRSTALAEEGARVEEQLRLRRALLAGMQGGPGGNVEGFSPYLAALARQTMSGVWLTGIEIRGGSEALVLKGRVVDGDLVPSYIRHLNREPLFRGRTVSELRLSAKNESAAKAEAPRRYVEFSLQIPLQVPSGKGPS
jgi:hypothetical protein